MRRWLADIRPSERRNVLGAFLTLFGVMVGHSLLETARDALFLARLSAEELPWVYLSIAGGALALTRAFDGKRRAARAGLVVTLLAAATGTGAFWLFTASRATWTLYGLYVWTGVIITLVTLRFWLLLGDLFTVTQAKRIFAPIGVGSVLGAIGGSATAIPLAENLGARALIPVAMATFAVTALVPLLVLRAPSREPPVDDEDETRASPPRKRRAERPHALLDDLAVLVAEPHARRIGLLVLVSTVALTLVDFVFKHNVSIYVRSDELGSFFAVVYTILNVISLFVQVFAVSWAVRRLGVTRAVCVLPVLLVIGSIGVAVGGGLVAALVVKGSEGSLKHSLHRTAMELLYLPFSNEMRSRFKSVIDVLGQRGGQAAASVLIIAVTRLGGGDGTHAAIVAGLGVVWLALAARMGRSWLALFRDTLTDTGIRSRLAFPELDVDSFERLVGALNSQDDAEVIAGMEMIFEQRRPRAVPALILYHPSSAVVLRALELFVEAGRTDFLPIADRLHGHDNEDVRVAALLARSALSSRRSVLLEARGADCPALRTAALISLVAHGWLPVDEALDRLAGEIVEDATTHAEDDPRTRGTRQALGIARALAVHPLEAFENWLHRLVSWPDLAVQRAAVEALAGLPSRQGARVLLPLLADRQIRGSARHTLVAYGDVALEVLEHAMCDLELPFAVRLHLPRTLSRFGNQAAANILVDRLLEEPDSRIRYKILRALGGLVETNPAIELDAGVLGRITLRTLRNALRLLAWRYVLVADAREHPEWRNDVHEMLVQMLDHMHDSAIERLFRLLGLEDRDEDFRSIYRGLNSSRRDVRSSSRELLEHALELPLRDSLLALVDEGLDDEVRLTLVDPQLLDPDLPETYEGVLQQLLGMSSEALRALAIYQVGALRIHTLGDALDTLEVEADVTGPMFETLVERARHRLDNNDDPTPMEALP